MKRKIISPLTEEVSDPIKEKEATKVLPPTPYSLLPTPSQVAEGISFVWSQWRRQKLPLVIFVLLCLNLVIAPAVYAAADGGLERRYAYTIGVLYLVTLGLAVYLFVVVFQPERF